ncbi:MAG: hypothetical protein AB7O96_12070 [Pseudobdellovibrionaceae bacterium]
MKKQSKKNFDVRTLRSINLEMDLPEPSRLLGYVPTRKAVTLSAEILSSLIGKSNDRAFAISAPYGSGKSSAALFWCQLLELGKKPAELKVLFEEAKKKDRQSEKDESVFCQWERRKPNGLAVPIVGFDGGSIPNVIFQAILNSLERNGQGALATKLKKLPKTMDGLKHAIELVTVSSGKYDALLIVWDEFGKVLERATLQGDGKALLEIQILAEFASRSPAESPFVFCILMHQTFARYSASLPGYVRNEWAKIEGRFRQINYIEDSKEIYELISQVVSRKYGIPEEKKSVFKGLAERCHAVGMFKEFDQEALTELLWSSAPLSPVSLYLLPRVSARVAQNERTMFSFLWSEETTALPQLKRKWVAPSDIFDFFADLMRIDTSIGGAHRLWVEANSALKKIESGTEEDLVKALACIKVGTSSGSLAGTTKILEIAFGDQTEASTKKLHQAVKSLEKKKAIFHRKLTGEYSVWQGSDVDIRGAVEENKAKLVESLDLTKVLTRDFAPPYRFPQRHNDIHCIRRYFDGRYILSNELDSRVASETANNDGYLDGRIYYVIAETAEELRKAVKAAESAADDRVLFAIPQFPLHLREGLAELEAYHQLLADPDFRKQDPIVEQELKQLADDSEQHLRVLVSKIMQPSVEGPIYFWKGHAYKDVDTMGALKRLLSKVCDKNYSQTPIINNELINKAEPSPQIVNARKSIIRGIFENYGKEQLGLSGYGPDVSVFRALFLNTGIYRKQASGWSFAPKGRELENKGLSEVWQIGIDFWSKPSRVPKDLRSLLANWQSPPFGMRRGIMPLILASSFRCAGSQAQVFEDGIFVTDFKPETFERMVRTPQAFNILVPELKKDFIEFLDNVIDLFTESEKQVLSGDRIRAAAQALMVWLKDLPQIARERGMLSPVVDEFVLTLLEARDPTLLLSESLKKNWSLDSYSLVFQKIEKLKKEIEGIESSYFDKCRSTLLAAIQFGATKNLNSFYQKWIETLPGMDSDELRKRYLTDKRAAGLISRIEQGYSTENLFVMSLAELFAEKPLKFWNSSSLSIFEVNLHQTIRWMEDLADDIDLETWRHSSSDSSGAGKWIEKRVRKQFERVVQRLGKKEAKKFVERVMESLGEGP